MVNLLVGIVVVALVVIIIRGVWRATAAQKGTGCPCCDKVLGADHDHDHEHGDHAGHDHAAGGKKAPASPAGGKS